MESTILYNDDEKNKLIKQRISCDNIYNNKILKTKNEYLKREYLSAKILTRFPLVEERNINKKISINKLQNNSFIYSEEKLGENIFEIDKDNKKIISYIDIDLLLQRIALWKNIYEDPDTEYTFLAGFCMQHTAFITTDILINKIISCFDYFYNKYLEENKENNFRNKTPFESKLNNAKKFTYNNEQKNKNIFKQKYAKVPYNIIYLLILFIDVHNKYSREILTLDIMNKIQLFIKKLLEIKEIKNKYEKDLISSSIILKEIKNSNFSKKTMKQKKIPFKNLIPKTILLKDLITSENNITYFDILKIDSKEIAIELTCISYNLFSKIKPQELLKGVFTKKNKKELSPNVVETTNRFNKLSFWAMEEILMYDKSKYRIAVIEKFIDIINELISLNNFFDSMSISSALGQIIISKLSKTWKRISKKSKELYKYEKNILNFANSYKLIKEKIKECVINKKPYIPFPSSYYKTICYLEEFGEYIKDNSLINANKIVLVQQTLDQLFKFKLKQYDLFHETKNELIILQYLDPATEDELDKLASLLEPNFKLYDKKQKEKRVSNTEKKFKINYENNPGLY